jgi:hypothetical protein
MRALDLFLLLWELSAVCDVGFSTDRPLICCFTFKRSYYEK